jgi:hypothetical protein
MTLTNTIELAVIARPGMSSAEIVAAVNADMTRDITRVCALLQQSCNRGKLSRTGSPRHWRYFPTAITGQDQRKARNKPDAASKRKRDATREARAAKKAGAPKPLAERQKPPKPTAASQIQVVIPPRPKASHHAGGTETVADFLARGGQIHRLGPHDSGNPLRFDHSRAEAPARRRGAVCARKADAQ